MSDYNGRLKDYVQVNERIIAFHLKYPEGSLQSEITVEPDRVTVKAFAYRTPDDPRPAIGHSWLAIPGTTPYTRGSELENAETSAWGRALAALGFEVKRGIASQEEVDNKHGARVDTNSLDILGTRQPTGIATPAQRNMLIAEARKAAGGEEPGDRLLGEQLRAIGRQKWGEVTVADVKLMLTRIEEHARTEAQDPAPADDGNIDFPEPPAEQPAQSGMSDEEIKRAEVIVNTAESRIRAQNPANGALISEAQGKRLFAIAHGNGGLLKGILADFGIQYSRDIPKSQYEQIVDAVQKAAQP